MENFDDGLFTELIEKFEVCREEWTDLPDYVYTIDYRKAFINFLENKLKEGHKLDKSIVVMALHHETGDRMPYFEFNRDK